VAQLIGELEALDQAIAQLLIGWLAQMARETLAQAVNGIAERCDVHGISLPHRPKPVLIAEMGPGLRRDGPW
jgi:hypothetical protein